MASLVYSAVLIVSILTSCNCSGSIGAMLRRLGTFNKRLNNFQVEIAERDTSIYESIDIATDSLRQELTEHIKQHIKEAKEEFRRDESVPNVVRAHVDSQVRRLKKGQKNMKRKLERVMESLRHVQQEKDLYRDALFKAERRIAELCYKCKCPSNSQLLSNVPNQGSETVHSHLGNDFIDKQNFNLTYVSKPINETYKDDMEEPPITPLSTTAKTTISPSTSTRTQIPKSTSKTAISHSSLTTTTTTISSSTTTTIIPTSSKATTTTPNPSTTTTTTIAPSAKTTTAKISQTTSATIHHTPVMNRLLMASVGESEMVQLDIHTGKSTKYSLHVPNGVTALCYIQRLRRLLVGTYKLPQRITSTSLDGDDTQTLREGIWVTGMAVDEGRELVFMSTLSPGHSISRMSTRGDNFTIIRNMTGGNSYPYNTAVNPRQREVYGSSGYSRRVFSVSYDGKVLKSLVSSDVNGVTFDSVSTTLYFHDGSTLKKISDGVVSDVITLSEIPDTLAYYNNTVYYGEIFGTRYVGAVRLGENIVENRLQTTSSTYNGYLIICLVQ